MRGVAAADAAKVVESKPGKMSLACRPSHLSQTLIWRMIKMSKMPITMKQMKNIGIVLTAAIASHFSPMTLNQMMKFLIAPVCAEEMKV